ncbi:DUF4377 domain-containing protein [Neisseria sp. Ec49-e6-T10]|uniref:DUF4377 domain-containing protein n=1 Tax=Neisseria sp. Ec49-e6-T10 TaxID=3140744 RepID=UPI003EB8D2F8
MKTLCAIGASVVLLSACQATETTNNTGEKIIEVGPKLIDCVGVAPMKCMQIKEQNSNEWTLLYNQINGFNYQPGYQYTLKVKVDKWENAPADASSEIWSLVKVLKQEAK